MGIAVVIVLLGYLLACALALALLAFLVRNRPGKQIVVVLGIGALAAAWPVWLVLGHRGLFDYVCRAGDTGVEILEAFRPTVVVRRGGDTTDRPPPWHIGPDPAVGRP